jgi:hypothetical protein
VAAIKPIQVWEVRPELYYAVASNAGPTHTGQVAKLGFVDGVAVSVLGHRQPSIMGRDIKGAVGLVQVWPYHEGHELWWNVDCWEYSPVAPPVAAPSSKPMRKAKTKRRRKSK